MLKRISLIAALVALVGYFASAAPPQAGPASGPAGAPAAANAPAGADEIHVVGPFTSGNLAVYLVRGPNLALNKKYLTLSEGLEQKKVIVYEKQQVNELAIENLSDEDLYVQAGEIVKGGQQDRTLARDMVIPPHSGQLPIACNCVEHGRWSQRGAEATGNFGSSENSLASKELKAANYAADQSAVWSNVSRTQQQLASNAPAQPPVTGQISARGTGQGAGQGAGSATAGQASFATSSLEMTMENGAVASAAKEYEQSIEKSAKDQTKDMGDVVGFIYAINGKLDSGDVYSSSDLFTKMYPKLLNAACVEALASRQSGAEKKTYDVPKPQEIEAILKAADAAPGEPQPLNATGMEQQINQQINAQSQKPAQQEAAPPQRFHNMMRPALKFKGDRVALLKRETKEMVVYESRDTQTDVPFLHRAYLTK